MLKLNRTTEYGLIALRHMSRKAIGITSAREIADAYGLPFEITAKTLQRLKESGLISSEQGARGGYTLQKRLGDVSLAEFLTLMEGPQGVVHCTTDSEEGATKGCEYGGRCEIKGWMGDLNSRLMGFLAGIHLDDLGLSKSLETLHVTEPVSWVAKGHGSFRGEEP